MTNHEVFWKTITDISKELEPQINLDLSNAINEAKKRMEEFDETKLDRMSTTLEVINAASQVTGILIAAVALIYQIRKDSKNNNNNDAKALDTLSKRELDEWKNEIKVWLEDFDDREKMEKSKVLKKIEIILKRKSSDKF